MLPSLGYVRAASRKSPLSKKNTGGKKPTAAGQQRPGSGEVVTRWGASLFAPAAGAAAAPPGSSRPPSSSPNQVKLKSSYYSPDPRADSARAASSRPSVGSPSQVRLQLHSQNGSNIMTAGGPSRPQQPRPLVSSPKLAKLERAKSPPSFKTFENPTYYD